ncbi:MAG: hypothetical protein NXH75_15685 [Halobacteriovoraceae bacterium]|nr:hypothetical protein [Halobacteriovoraceae bacterium]
MAIPYNNYMKSLFFGILLLLSSPLFSEELSQKLWDELNFAVGKTKPQEREIIEEDFISTSLAAPQREEIKSDKKSEEYEDSYDQSLENQFKKAKPWKTRVRSR